MEDSRQIDLPLNLNAHALNGRAATLGDEERHTDEIQDIITKVPSWVIRWGIMIFFAVLLIVISISAIIRYPDVVKNRIRFQPIEADRLVITNELTTIKYLTVTQGQNIRSGQLLAVMKNEDGKELNLVAPVSGKLGFAVLAQPGVILQPQQSLFVIHPLQQHFLGIMQMPVALMQQVKVGQTVIISLGDKQNQTSNQLKGKISALTDEPDKNGMITVRVLLDNTHSTSLKAWMTGDAQILTRNISVSERIWSSIVKKM